MVHDTDIYVISVSAVKIAQDFFGITPLAGEQKMADDKTLLHEPRIRVNDRSPCLPEHFGNCGASSFKIIRRFGILGGELGGIIFQIGEIDINQAF